LLLSSGLAFSSWRKSGAIPRVAGPPSVSSSSLGSMTDMNRQTPWVGRTSHHLVNVNAGTAQSVTPLSPLIKHGGWAGASIQNVMMENAMRVKAFVAVLNLHALAARRIL
jgi:hypothetical protein